jgi:hypothetical protein
VSFLVDVKKWDAKLQITALLSLPSETSAKSYALTAEQSKTEDGGLELEVVLSAKPNSNSINIPFSKENIILFYQPPLTEEFKQEDCEIWTETYVKTKKGLECWRPENVVGSYAIYHISKQNNDFKTGKICHIFRPKLIDADGKEAWAEFNRDANETGVLTITLPQTFLDSAKYPVTVDPTFGYTTHGGSWTGVGSEGFISGRFQLSENGTITSITAYLRSSGSTRHAKAGYYTDKAGPKPDALRSQDGEHSISSPAEITFDITDQAESAGYFWLAVEFDNAEGQIAYDSTGTCEYCSGDPYASAMPNPAPSTYFANLVISIYATYTSGVTVKTVADSLSLAETVLRNKSLILSDSLGLTEALYGNKSLLLSDSASLSELITVIIGQVMKYVADAVSAADLVNVLKSLKMSDTVALVDAVSTPSRVLPVLEAIGAADSFVVNKVLQITETVSLAEIVEVGTGGVKKTKLFLILGDLTVQLTGD